MAKISMMMLLIVALVMLVTTLKAEFSAPCTPLERKPVIFWNMEFQSMFRLLMESAIWGWSLKRFDRKTCRSFT